jgi:hypothetical protein
MTSKRMPPPIASSHPCQDCPWLPDHCSIVGARRRNWVPRRALRCTKSSAHSRLDKGTRLRRLARKKIKLGGAPSIHNLLQRTCCYLW